MKPVYVYLDLNIFDRIEKLSELTEPEKTIYQEIKALVNNGNVIVPYSNAHLNDLFRGYQKNPNYINSHLENIEYLTKNLCICQYWNRKETTWHYRDIKEFFNEKKTEWEYEPASFEEQFDDPLFSSIFLPFKFIELPKEWKLGYIHDPMFGVMFPKSKIYNSFYSLMEDIYEFQVKLKSDYSLYKNFKSYLIKGISKLRNNQQYLKSIRQNFKDLPKHLDIFEISEVYGPKNDALKNKNYSDVLDVFFKYDLQGYKSDAHYNNMFDDSLHTFYASHCEFFITNDDRCKYKAEKTYERLNIKTKVIKASDWKEIIE